jgi:hypothetical protein
MTALRVAHGALLYLLLGWKVFHLARAPRNVPLRCVVACLAFAAASFTVLLPTGLVPPGNRWMIFIQFFLILATSCALDCFFLFSLISMADARRLAARRALGAAVAAALIALASGAGIRDQAVPAVSASYLLFEAANGALLADALRWALRGIAGAEPVLARGLRVTSAGLALMLAALVPVTAVAALRWARLPGSSVLLAAAPLIAVLGIVVFLAGVGYPGAIMRMRAVFVYARHYRLHRQMAPLWDELHRAYPQDALTRVPAPGWREALSPWGVHRRYYRRVIECRDGLVRISPRLGAADGPPLAERLLAALRTVPAAGEAPGQAVAVAVPAAAGLDADALALAALAGQLTGTRRARAGAASAPPSGSPATSTQGEP